MMSGLRGKQTSSLTLAAAWIVVVIPLAWGVYQTAIKALPLFAGPTAQAAPPPRPRDWPEETAGDSQRWAGKPAEDDVKSPISPPRQCRREMAEILTAKEFALLAQLAEQLTLNQRVVGSSPTGGMT
jgi:hypothetical protein